MWYNICYKPYYINWKYDCKIGYVAYFTLHGFCQNAKPIRSGVFSVYFKIGLKLEIKNLCDISFLFQVFNVLCALGVYLVVCNIFILLYM